MCWPLEYGVRAAFEMRWVYDLKNGVVIGGAVVIGSTAGSAGSDVRLDVGCVRHRDVGSSIMVAVAGIGSFGFCSQCNSLALWGCSICSVSSFRLGSKYGPDFAAANTTFAMLHVVAGVALAVLRIAAVFNLNARLGRLADFGLIAWDVA